MILFRNTYVRNAMALFTGLVFLNMSFFLAEVSALKLTQDKKMVENIAKLISSSAAEEEKDAFGGHADEDCSAKEVDLIFNYATHSLNTHILLIKDNRYIHDQQLLLLGTYEIFSPPPEG